MLPCFRHVSATYVTNMTVRYISLLYPPPSTLHPPLRCLPGLKEGEGGEWLPDNESGVRRPAEDDRGAALCPRAEGDGIKEQLLIRVTRRTGRSTMTRASLNWTVTASIPRWVESVFKGVCVMPTECVYNVYCPDRRDGEDFVFLNESLWQFGKWSKITDKQTASCVLRFRLHACQSVLRPLSTGNEDVQHYACLTSPPLKRDISSESCSRGDWTVPLRKRVFTESDVSGAARDWNSIPGSSEISKHAIHLKLSQTNGV